MSKRELVMLKLMSATGGAVLPAPDYLSLLHALRDRGLVIAVQPPGYPSYRYEITDAGREALRASAP